MGNAAAKEAAGGGRSDASSEPRSPDAAPAAATPRTVTLSIDAARSLAHSPDSRILLELSVYSPVAAGSSAEPAARLRERLDAAAAGVYGRSEAALARSCTGGALGPHCAALAAASLAALDELKLSSAALARVRTSTSTPGALEAGEAACVTWAFGATVAVRPGVDWLLVEARDLRGAPGAPVLAGAVLLPEWWLGGGSSRLARLPLDAAVWLVAASAAAAAAVSGHPQLRVTAAAAAPPPESAPPPPPPAVGAAGAEGSAPAPPASGSLSEAASGSGALALAPPASPKKPAPPAAARARQPASVNAASPPTDALLPAAADNRGAAPAATAPATAPSIVVLAHSHTVYCDRKRQVCTAAGAVREGNRLGLAAAALGVEPAGPGELRGPRLPPGTMVTWYRSAAPAAGFEPLHASLAAHGLPSQVGHSHGGQLLQTGVLPAVTQGRGGDVGAAAAACASIAASEQPPPPLPPASSLEHSSPAHPATVTDAATGLELLALASGERELDALVRIPAAPGIDVSAPAPPPDPSDPHAGSPLFTSTAAVRLLRAQAQAAQDDPAQFFCALSDVGHYIAAAITAPGGHDTVLLPAVGPVEPGLPRFREVWLEVHRWASGRGAAASAGGVEAPDAGGVSSAAPAWELQPHGTTPQPGDALVARALYFGGAPSPACTFAWIRVDGSGERTETAPAPHLPHAPLLLPALAASAEAGASAVTTSGPCAADPRVYIIAPGDDDCGCAFKVTAEPVRWDGESGAPTTSKPTADVMRPRPQLPSS